MNEKFCRHSYTMWKSDHPSFLTRRMVGGRRPLLRKILGPSDPAPFENEDFQSILARSASALTPSEKRSMITNRKSTTSFAMSPRWTAYVASKPPKGDSKTKIDHFSSKSVLLLKKVCCKVSLCENFQRQSCKAFTGLSSRAQMVGGGRPLKRKVCAQSEPPVAAPKLTHPSAQFLCDSSASCWFYNI